MFLITGGCSFTAHQEDQHLSWANQLAEMPDYCVINTAEMASGNALISRNILEALEQYKKDKPYVMIMWSSPNRFELFYDSNHSIQSQMKEHPAFYNHTWLKSGGGYGFWKYESKIADRDVETYLKYYHNQEYQFMQTLEHILRIQWYCKVNKLKLFNFCWQTIFWGNNSANGSSEKSTALLSPIVEQYTSCTHLWDMIDWNDWYLYKKGGLWEFCIDKGYEIPNGMHPNREAQLQWLNEFVIPLLQR